MQPFRLQLGRLFVFAPLSGGFLLVGQLADAFFHFLEIGRQTFGVDAQLAGGLVDEVDGLVGQLPAGDVAVAEAGRGIQGGIVNLDLVVGFVAGPQGFQDFHRVFYAGFFQIDRLEATFQGGVLFDVLPVFVGGGGADALEFAPGQGRLEQIAGVQAAFVGAGADHGVDFVQEEDDFAMGLLYFVHDCLEPFLELAAELGAGDQGAHVQSQDAAALQGIGHVVAGDPGCQALGDGGFAHAGLADDNRVVLLAAGQGLGYPADFGVPADDRVQLAIGGQLGQVDAVAFQGPVAALGAAVVHPVGAADGGQGLVNLFLVDAKFLNHPGRIALRFADGGDEEVLHADEVVFEPPGLFLGGIQ